MYLSPDTRSLIAKRSKSENRMQITETRRGSDNISMFWAGEIEEM